MDGEEGRRLGDELLKIKRKELEKHKESLRSLHLASPFASIKNFFHWPHIAVRCERIAIPK